MTVNHRTRRGVLAFLTALVGLPAMLSTGAHADSMPTQQATRAATIVVGKVSGNPQKAFPQLEAMAEYLATSLRDTGVQTGGAVVAQNNQDMIDLLLSGDVDVVSETAFSAVDFATRAGAEILLWEWKNGLDYYRTIIFAPKDSGIRALADLRGKRIGFEDPGSTSGFLMPLAALRQAGLETEETAIDAKPTGDRLGYLFAGDDVNIHGMVVRGIVDAGVSNSEDWEDFLVESGATEDDFIILYKGPAIMRSAVLVRPGMDERLKARIAEILLAADDDPAAEEPLKKYNKVKKYERVAGAAAASLDAVRDLYPLVAGEIR